MATGTAKRISAKELVACIKSGLSHSDIALRHGVSDAKLDELFRKLVDAGLVREGDLPLRPEAPAAPLANAAVIPSFKCPACGMPQIKGHVICADCGIVFEDFKGGGPVKPSIKSEDIPLTTERIGFRPLYAIIILPIAIIVTALAFYNVKPRGAVRPETNVQQDQPSVIQPAELDSADDFLKKKEADELALINEQRKPTIPTNPSITSQNEEQREKERAFKMQLEEKRAQEKEREREHQRDIEYQRAEAQREKAERDAQERAQEQEQRTAREKARMQHTENLERINAERERIRAEEAERRRQTPKTPSVSYCKCCIKSRFGDPMESTLSVEECSQKGGTCNVSCK